MNAPELPLVVRYVWKNGNDVASFPTLSEGRDRYKRPPDCRGVYRQTEDGTQAHVRDVSLNERWLCRQCGAPVSIALPHWGRETLGDGFIEEGIDYDSEPLYWPCSSKDCFADGNGCPIEVEEML